MDHVLNIVPRRRRAAACASVTEQTGINYDEYFLEVENSTENFEWDPRKYTNSVKEKLQF